MGGGHAIFVIDLPIGGMGVVIGRAVPTGNPNFGMEDGAGGFRSTLWKRGGRSLLDGWRRRRGGLDVMVSATGDGEAQGQQSGESQAEGVQGIPTLHSS